MKIRYLSIIFLLAAITAHAQDAVNGVVTEVGKNTKLGNVFIRDINSKQVSLTDDDGSFYIRTAVGHTLIFTLAGYGADTLYVVDLKPKKVELTIRGIALSDVNVSGTAATFNPEEEYPEVYEKSQYALSFSRVFGKESRDARRLKKYFKNEKEQRQIDSVFNKVFVTSILPLKGRELDNFMIMYRPTLKFVKASSQQTLTLYVNDSYTKFKTLPYDQREGQTLGTTGSQ